MSHPQSLSIHDFSYSLPEEKIAKYPLPNRSDSKLMRVTQTGVEHLNFFQAEGLIGDQDVLLTNNTKVIPARLHFTKKTGGLIEIFLLEPMDSDYTTALSSRRSCRWKCLVGGAKKWKDDPLDIDAHVGDATLTLIANKIAQEDHFFIVEFQWNGCSFSEILEAAGELPIPPYLNRKTESQDYSRYQTLFAQWEGSVAAPTASLHFDTTLIEKLKKKGTKMIPITLHVGAGTFKPVSTENIGHHTMHEEYFEISLESLENLASVHGNWIAVGTTVLRTMESLHCIAANQLTPHPQNGYWVNQWAPYENPSQLTRKEALDYLIHTTKQRGENKIWGKTQILIAPGYSFKMMDVLITNFHQPNSTLLLLVSAIIGNRWKQIYQIAMDSNYRFLSYGDSSWIPIDRK
jgi:S-adenosylmethionine:tRNA ribosyltransferase-isomerase